MSSYDVEDKELDSYFIVIVRSPSLDFTLLSEKTLSYLHFEPL